MPADADIIIIGAGIVGLATAYQISRDNPGIRIRILEKERSYAMHQTGRNSGVIHSGIYYKPGSLKAVNCRLGKKSLEEFCRKEKVHYEVCGKIILANGTKEEQRLRALYERGTDNGVNCRIFSEKEIQAIEPHASGTLAIHVPETGIVDYSEVCKKLTELLIDVGNQVHYNCCVSAIRETNNAVIVRTKKEEFTARIMINCAGLYSDRIAGMSGCRYDIRIIPFRGEYFQLTPEAGHLCRHLIYPVPDPDFPFLGVHFTRMAGGGVECGPNAVLGFGREAYRKTDFHFMDTAEMMLFPGFWRLSARYWKTGIHEYRRSLFKKAFVRSLRKLIPDIESRHLTPIESGIRAQAVSRDGKLLDDFRIEETPRMIHVLNAPSPAATASFNIGKIIAGKLEKKLQSF